MEIGPCAAALAPDSDRGDQRQLEFPPSDN
jgi:hypothetical protein